MSVILNLEHLTIDIRKKLSRELEVIPRETNYGKQESILCFKIENKDEENKKKYFIKLPFSYVYHNTTTLGLKTAFPNGNIDYSRSSGYEFTGTLNRVQSEVKDEVYDILNRTRSILISLFCGCGKTIFSIFLASKLQYKTIVLCHRLNLIDQWEYSIRKVCPDASIQIVSGNTVIDKDVDFCIMNVSNVTKRGDNEFSHIGLLIIDEAHTICTENLSQSLFWFQPKYTIALTATPERTDGKGKILELYFGPERIERKLWRPFNCYAIHTMFKPTVKQNRQGRLDWSGVLESQALNEDRNDMIVDLIRYFKTRNFLVLCKRVDQGTILYNKLKRYKQDVDVFTGTNKQFNKNSRILISTYSKTGVGFDHPKLDALIVASDVEEGIEQYVGRVFRREDVVPIVFDIVDKMHTLQKHFYTRKKLYESIGAKINDFDYSFIEFEKWRRMM